MPQPQKITPWKLISSQKAFDVKWFPIRRDTVQLPSGDIVDDYYVAEIGDVAVVVPITPDGKFILCQQYRHGVAKVMFQFPSGMVDPGETPEQAARRELLEEAGYEAPHLESLTTTALCAAKMIGWQYIFLAEGAIKKQEPHDDPIEEIRIVTVTPAELERMIDNNEFQIPDSLAAALLVLRRINNLQKPKNTI